MGLYISASGILNAQRRFDVTSNNVANVRTTGYRAQRAISSETPGGGAQVSSVDRSDAQGPIELTGRDLDVASDAGFLQVRTADGSLAYTRDGSFGLNAQGEVVTSDGARLEPAIRVPADASRVSVAADGTVTAYLGDGTAQPVGQIEVFQFTNPNGLEAVGGNLFRPTAASGEAQAAPGFPNIITGAVQSSNVDLATEQVNNVLDRNAFQANVSAFQAQADALGDLLNIIS